MDAVPASTAGLETLLSSLALSLRDFQPDHQTLSAWPELHQDLRQPAPALQPEDPPELLAAPNDITPDRARTAWELLRALGPVITDAIRLRSQLWAQRMPLARVLEHASEPLVIADPDGYLLHGSAAARHLMQRAVHREHLEGEIRAMVRDAADRLSGARMDGPGPILQREVELGGEVYHLRGSCLMDAPEADQPFLIITVVRCEPSREHHLRERYRLTRREARIALLLAERKTNLEISGELRLSPHTVRHHTERVLAKLGVTSRIQVGAIVRSG